MAEKGEIYQGTGRAKKHKIQVTDVNDKYITYKYLSNKKGLQRFTVGRQAFDRWDIIKVE